MKDLFKKIICFLLAALLFAGAAFTNPSSVYAKITTIYETAAIAYAGTPYTQQFTVNKSCDIGFLIYTTEPATFTLTIYNSADVIVRAPAQITASDSDWLEIEDEGFVNGCVYRLPAGDYSLALDFDAATVFYLEINEDTPEAVISNTNLTITAGFTKTLTVTNNTGSVTWKSSDNAVAAVNNNGKVTAKADGQADITASVDGRELICRVTVKKNKYSAGKLTNSQVLADDAIFNTYSASYNSKGDLVVKIRMVNNSGHDSEYLKNLSVKVKTAAGKTIGTYKAGKKTLRVPNQSYKDFSITIKQADLKIKKADLRNAKITTAGEYAYIRYNYR